MRKTKIVCTIGPASGDVETLKELMKAGMNVARINFSHGSYPEQEKYINAVKQARKELGLPVALLLDMQGPEIRTGKLKESPVYLVTGDKFVLVNEDIEGDQTKTSVSYKQLYQDVKPGTKILIDDGSIELEVEKIENKDIQCIVTHGAKLGSRKTINVPGIKLNLPSLKEKDIQDLKDAVKADFDLVAASFVRRKQDILDVRKVLNENGGEKIKVIAKIENQEGIDNEKEILGVSDGIMVARGDMGVEVPLEMVPIVQKRFIKSCYREGKIVITATQMLESMTENPRPTRAEVSDVANAIFDGTGAIMLSGESAMGKYPVECVKTMVKIADAVESSLKYWKRFKNREYDLKSLNYEFNLNYSICFTAMQMDAKAIIAYTECGDTPRIIASYLPACPIYAFTSNERTYRQLALYWNVHPFLLPKGNTVNHMLKMGIEKLKEQGKLKEGDAIVIAGGASILKEDETIKDEVNRSIGGVLKL